MPGNWRKALRKSNLNSRQILVTGQKFGITPPTGPSSPASRVETLTEYNTPWTITTTNLFPGLYMGLRQRNWLYEPKVHLFSFFILHLHEIVEGYEYVFIMIDEYYIFQHGNILSNNRNVFDIAIRSISHVKGQRRGGVCVLWMHLVFFIDYPST